MNDIYAQYSSLDKSDKLKPEKNPNRVLGGLRGSGSEILTMVSEDGSEQQIPSVKYVKELENKIREQDKLIRELLNRVRNLELKSK